MIQSPEDRSKRRINADKLKHSPRIENHLIGDDEYDLCENKSPRSPPLTLNKIRKYSFSVQKATHDLNLYETESEYEPLTHQKEKDEQKKKLHTELLKKTDLLKKTKSKLSQKSKFITDRVKKPTTPSFLRFNFSLSQAFPFGGSTSTRDEKFKEKWSSLDFETDPGKTLRNLVRQNGISAELRGEVWSKVSRAQRYHENDLLCYPDLRNNRDFTQRESVATIQIAKDLARTHVGDTSESGKQALRNVLTSYSWYNPTVGYCQAMNVVVSLLLMYMSEDLAFWMLHSIIVNVLPPDFYTSNLRGLLVEMCVLNHLATKRFPRVVSHITSMGLSLDIFSARWFLSLYVTVFPFSTSLRILDSLFFEGSAVLLRVMLALLKIFKQDILACDNPADLLVLLRDLPSRIDNDDLLLDTAFNSSAIGSFKKKKLEKLRTLFSAELKMKNNQDENEEEFYIFDSAEHDSIDVKEEEKRIDVESLQANHKLEKKCSPISPVELEDNTHTKKTMYRPLPKPPPKIQSVKVPKEMRNEKESSPSVGNQTTPSFGNVPRSNVILCDAPNKTREIEKYRPLSFVCQQNEQANIIEDYTPSE